MGNPALFGRGKLLKRVRQAAYVGSHPVSHSRCSAAVRRSGIRVYPGTSLKYVGDHLALSLQAAERRCALMTHYDLLARLLRPGDAAQLADGIPVWRKPLTDGTPDLAIYLEPSRLAPMEGELQLRFAFRSNLNVLTFLIAPGDVFGSSSEHLLFIGGVQGRPGAREELREASRLNAEIAPATMLILAAQVIAKVTGINDIVGVGEKEHISLGYASSELRFDYGALWREAGGISIGRHYRLPLETPQKPLSEIPLSHRSRARRRREQKAAVRQSIEARIQELFGVV